MKRVVFPALITVLLLAGRLSAQDQPPGTDIYLLELATLTAPPLNLTRRPGYDNQPSFSPDGRTVYYTRIEGGQADIYRIDIETGAASAVLESADSEYSPTPMPGRPALSVVRVEADQRQRLWSIPLDGSAPELIFPGLEPVGYHAWARPGVAALFVLGEPHTLQLIGPDGQARVVAENIGRAIVADPTRPGAIAFVAKRDPGPWTIRELNTGSGEIASLIETLPQREDFTIGPAGDYWMGADGRLYCRRTASDGWRLMADLSGHGITNITRLAIDPAGRRLALVGDEPPGDED